MEGVPHPWTVSCIERRMPATKPIHYLSGAEHSPHNSLRTRPTKADGPLSVLMLPTRYIEDLSSIVIREDADDYLRTLSQKHKSSTVAT